MILPSKPILSIVIQRIEFVAPVAGEIEPFCRCVGGEVGCGKGIVEVVVGICMGV